MTGVRFSLSEVSGRGAGLGNELIPWARSYLAAQVLNAHCLTPAFGLNRRGYRQHFGTSRFDWLVQRALKVSLPVVEFNEADYIEHGGGDVVASIRSFAAAQRLFDRNAYLFVTKGMWGGMNHIEAAREFVASKLYLSRYASSNILKVRARINRSLPVVGVHIRQGDFGAPLPPHEYRGKFNISLPLDWYRRVVISIYEQLGGKVQFLIVSDAAPCALGQSFSGLPCIFSGDILNSDCSDILLLSQSDLIVCSVSSFSVWAAFLSKSPYIWYRPNLYQHEDGFLSIWGHEKGQQFASSPTIASIAATKISESTESRAWAVGHEGVVPARALEQALQLRERPENDLIRYGVIWSQTNRQ